jgi:lecithin:retinol acyltransferase
VNGEPMCPGGWIRVFVPRAGVWHHGIVAGIPYLTAGLFTAEVAHNRKLTGVAKTDLLTDFAVQGQPIFLHRRPHPALVRQILARVESSLGKPYHLFAQNCEHFASYAFTGKAESSSVKTVGVFALGCHHHRLTCRVEIRPHQPKGTRSARLPNPGIFSF